jgi:hypothetical protein
MAMGRKNTKDTNEPAEAAINWYSHKSVITLANPPVMAPMAKEPRTKPGTKASPINKTSAIKIHQCQASIMSEM